MPVPLRLSALLLSSLLLAGLGCAGQVSTSGQPAAPAAGPATWTLEQIGDAPQLPRAAVSSVDAPPLEAVALFAGARAASQDGDRARAIALLQRAIELDPDSFELQYELGTLYRHGLGYQPRALAAFERATRIDPDRLDAQLDIARQLLAKGDGAAALRRLRLAIQTTQYAQGQLRSAEADFLLAHALRDQGYDRAALDRFELLLSRLTRGEVERSDEVARLLNHRLFMQIGDLYLKRDQPAEALRAYRTAEGTPGGAQDIDVQSRIVRAMMLDGQVTQGMARAADVVRQFGASPAALGLLRDVYSAIGRPEGIVSVLSDLHRQHPDDRLLLFALCEVLAADGRFGDAEEKLTVAWQRSSGQPALLVWWFRLRFDRDPESAVRLLADLLADTPQAAGQIEPVWSRLISAEGRSAMSIDRLAAMKASNPTRAAHAFIVHRVARDWPRSTLADRSLRAALAERPVFPPAFIARADEILAGTTLPLATRIAAVTELATAAELAGAPGLSDLLQGRMALARGDLPEATTCFAAAARRHPTWPEPQLGLADALLAAGERTAAVRQAWDVVKAFGDYEPGFRFLNDQPDVADPSEVMTAWKAAQAPGEAASPRIALQQAEDRLSRGDAEGAALLLADLERQSPADPRLLDLQRRIDRAGDPANETSAEITRMERLAADARRIGPAGFTEVAGELADRYAQCGRPNDAERVLANARLAVAAEPDLLCRLAFAARRIGRDDLAENWLQASMELDPQQRAAAQALASLWADRGRLLDAAEQLARTMSARWPGDPATHATLGWVLYRAGKLDQSRDELLSAIRLSGGDAQAADAGNAAPVDPVLLDRAGDVLYRLGDRVRAAEYWERAQRRLGDADVAATDRADLRAMRQSLPRKLQQHRTGQEVGLPIANFQLPVGNAAP